MELVQHAFPPFCLIGQVLYKVPLDQTKKMLLITPACHTQPCYPQLQGILISNPTPGQRKKLTQIPFRQRISSSRCELPEINEVENLWKQLHLARISQMVFQLITRPRRGRSTSSFESTWRKWVGWCIGKKVDPLHCDITASLNFLREISQAIYE